MKKDIKKKTKETKKKNKKKNTGIYTVIIAFVIIAATALIIRYNAPIIEVEEAQLVEEKVEKPEEILEESQKSEISEGLETESQSEPAEMIPPEPEQPSKENIIEIRKDAFYPKEKIITKNTEIKWVKKDTRDYNLNCYLGGTRVIQSPDLKEGDSFTYIFLEEGKYTCITTPYGLRNIITVETQPLLSPTGRVVLKEGQGIDGFSLAAMIIITMALILAFSYRGKKKLR